MQEYFSDLLYKVDLHGHEGYIYILFEHKSYSEKWIGLQLLEYMLQCWKLKQAGKEQVPVIIPLVVYHGQGNWTAGNQFADIIEVKHPQLRQYVPDFSYLVYDLVRYPDEKLEGITDLKVMLYLMKYIKAPDFEKQLGRILQMLAVSPD